MTAPSTLALNRASVVGWLEAQRADLEGIRRLTVETNEAVAAFDHGLRPEVRREREAILRLQGRERVAERLERVRQRVQTARELAARNSRTAALRRQRFAASDTEHATVGAFWLQLMDRMSIEEIVEVIRDHQRAPSGGAVAFIGALVARGKLDRVESDVERTAAARALDDALAGVDLGVEDVGKELAAIVAVGGEAEIAAALLDERRDAGRILTLAREHGVVGPVREAPHPAAAGGGAAV